MNHSLATLTSVILLATSLRGFCQTNYPYNPTLSAPPVVGVGTGGENNAAPPNTTTLPQGIYDYLTTGVYSFAEEGPAVSAGSFLVGDAARLPAFQYLSSAAAPNLVAYRVYRKAPGDTYHRFLTSVTRSAANYDGFGDFGALTPSASVIAPSEAAAIATPATGYTVSSPKSRLYQGGLFSITVLPAGSSTAQFAQGQTFTLSSSDGSSATVTPPRAGGVISLPMSVAGTQTVAVSSGGKFADPAPSSFPVIVLPALRTTNHTGAPAAGFDLDNSAYVKGFVQPIEGRAHLMFLQGETVGFHLPYQIYGVPCKANAWEVLDFQGNLVDSGVCDVNISTPRKSDTIITSKVTSPGAYSLFLYDTTRPAGTPDFVNVSRFVVLSASRSKLPGIAMSAIDEYAYQANLRFELMSNVVATTSESALNGYIPGANKVRLVRRSFSFTPASTASKSLACGNARITVAGQVTQPFAQYPQFFDNQDKYTPVVQTFQAGTAYVITVENFLPATLGLPPVQFSDGTALAGTFKSDAGTADKITVYDFPAILTDGSGDHDDPGARACLGEAGSLQRFPVSNSSQASDFAAAIANFYALGLVGNQDPARERRRVIFNFFDLLNVQQHVDYAHDGTTLQTYSSQGITAFVNGVIALGMNPADFVVEGANEPQGSDPAYYGALMVRLYDAVKAANPGVQVVGASSVDIFANSLSFQRQAIAAAANKLDGVSVHLYNAIVGDYANGQVTLAALAAWQSDNHLVDLPLWQTEQGADYTLHGTAYLRYAPRLVLTQKLLLERFGIPAARDLYWAPTNDWESDPSGYMQTVDYGACVMYPAFLALRTWSDEIRGLAYHGPVVFGGDWDQRLFGNFYTGTGGGLLALATNGASSFALPVTVSGNVTSLAARTWEGKDVTVPVANGTAVLPLDEMMLFVRVPAGVTLTPNLPTLGSNLALAAQLSTPEPTTGSLALLHDGSDAGTTRPIGIDGSVTINTPTAWKDVGLVVDFGTPTTFNQVHLSCPFPFQSDGTLLDFTVQSWDGAQWVTQQSVTQTVKGLAVTDGEQNSRLDDYSERAFLFLLSFAPVRASKVQILIYSASHGVSPTPGMAAYGNHYDTPASNQPTLREVAVYNAASPGSNPAPSYASWQASHFTAAQLADPAISGDGADPSGSGVTNLQAYAWHLDPFAPDLAGTPQVGVVTQGASTYLTLTYTKLKTATDLRYVVEVSADLANWNSGNTSTADVSATDNGATQLVTTCDSTAIVPATPPRAIRLRVIRQ